MKDKIVKQEKNQAKIKNLTRNTLNLKLPGTTLSLLPGTVAEVYRPFLETNELKALKLQGAILEVASVPGALEQAEDTDVKAVQPDEAAQPDKEAQPDSGEEKPKT